MNTYDILVVPNPLLAALYDVVNSYDEETYQVSRVALNAAREVLAGRVPSYWYAESE